MYVCIYLSIYIDLPTCTCIYHHLPSLQAHICADETPNRVRPDRQEFGRAGSGGWGVGGRISIAARGGLVLCTETGLVPEAQ